MTGCSVWQALGFEECPPPSNLAQLTAEDPLNFFDVDGLEVDHTTWYTDDIATHEQTDVGGTLPDYGTSAAVSEAVFPGQQQEHGTACLNSTRRLTAARTPPTGPAQVRISMCKTTLPVLRIPDGSIGNTRIVRGVEEGVSSPLSDSSVATPFISRSASNESLSTKRRVTHESTGCECGPSAKKKKSCNHVTHDFDNSMSNAPNPAVGSNKRDNGKCGGNVPNTVYRFWSLAETEQLIEGVARCGGGKWAEIKKLSFPAIESRSAVDLKDKWRNLMRIAMLPVENVKQDRKRDMSCPPELLASVRDLLRIEESKKQARASRNSRRGGRQRRDRTSAPEHIHASSSSFSNIHS